MKILSTLLLTLACALGASAQTFTLTAYGQPVTPDQVIKVGYEEQVKGVRYVQDPELMLTPEATGDFTVEIWDAPDNSSIQCCFSGQCQTLSGGELVTHGTAAAGSATNLRIERILTTSKPQESASVKCSVMVYPKGRPMLATTFTLSFEPITKEEAGIDDIVGATDAVSFDAAARTLAYSLSAPSTLCLYSATGACVVRRPLHGTGTLSLPRIPAGIYVYRVANLRGKIIVR